MNLKLAELCPDDFCPICGVCKQFTHAPWCEFSDGTPVPEELRETVKALEECKAAFQRLTASEGVGDGALLWAVSELWHAQGIALAKRAVGDAPF